MLPLCSPAATPHGAAAPRQLTARVARTPSPPPLRRRPSAAWSGGRRQRDYDEHKRSRPGGRSRSQGPRDGRSDQRRADRHGGQQEAKVGPRFEHRVYEIRHRNTDRETHEPADEADASLSRATGLGRRTQPSPTDGRDRGAHGGHASEQNEGPLRVPQPRRVQPRVRAQVGKREQLTGRPIARSQR
jgi:hypothetical protein